MTYGTEAFFHHLDALMTDADSESGARLLFWGGAREGRQEALSTLTRYATGNVHQFRMRSLLGEYRMRTQNSLRKAFDHAAEETALLYFEEVDALFRYTHADAPDNPDRTAAPTPVEYVFDRVAAYEGVVVLGLQRRRYVEWAEAEADLVVRFE